MTPHSKKAKRFIPAILPESIESKIYLLCSKRVMLDRDLAKLYRVFTKVLNQAVRRNLDRFRTILCFN